MKYMHKVLVYYDIRVRTTVSCLESGSYEEESTSTAKTHLRSALSLFGLGLKNPGSHSGARWCRHTTEERLCIRFAVQRACKRFQEPRCRAGLQVFAWSPCLHILVYPAWCGTACERQWHQVGVWDGIWCDKKRNSVCVGGTQTLLTDSCRTPGKLPFSLVFKKKHKKPQKFEDRSTYPTYYYRNSYGNSLNPILAGFDVLSRSTMTTTTTTNNTLHITQIRLQWTTKVAQKCPFVLKNT